jgi:hypothetical protein
VSDLSPAGVRLHRAIDDAMPRLLAISPEDAIQPRAEGKWSRVEIMGHLVDSASNNHQRFVRAADQNHLVFAGYEQDKWVARQQYQTTPWIEVITLWRLYNGHIARVMSAIPRDVRSRLTIRHNLDQIAFHPHPDDEPATLEYLMNDYVDHLEHHLAQVLS